MEFEDIDITQVASIFLDKRYTGYKLVHAKLLDGTVGIVDSNSLQKVLDCFPLFLFRISREELICRSAVRLLKLYHGKATMDLYGPKRPTISLTICQYQNILIWKNKCNTEDGRRRVTIL